MTTVHHVFVGAVKSAEGGRGGVFRQALGSQRWDLLDDGLPGDAEVHAITVDPNATDTVMIATTKGAFRSKNRVRRTITSLRCAMKCSISSFSPIVRGWRFTSAMLIIDTVISHGVYW